MTPERHLHKQKLANKQATNNTNSAPVCHSGSILVDTNIIDGFLDRTWPIATSLWKHDWALTETQTIKSFPTEYDHNLWDGDAIISY